MWLTVPVHAHGRDAERICDVRIDEPGWQRKHWTSIKHSYAKAPYFDQYASELESALRRRHAFLCELNNDLLRLFLCILGIGVRLLAASDYDLSGKKSEFLLDLCGRLGATTFVYGSRGHEYADVDAFHAAGVDVIFQDYRHPVYPQRYGEFLPCLSAIDLLFNEGPRSLETIFRGNVGPVAPREIGRAESQQNHPLHADLRIKDK